MREVLGQLGIHRSNNCWNNLGIREPRQDAKYSKQMKQANVGWHGMWKKWTSWISLMSVEFFLFWQREVKKSAYKYHNKNTSDKSRFEIRGWWDRIEIHLLPSSLSLNCHSANESTFVSSTYMFPSSSGVWSEFRMPVETLAFQINLLDPAPFASLKFSVARVCRSTMFGSAEMWSKTERASFKAF